MTNINVFWANLIKELDKKACPGGFRSLETYDE